MSWTIFGIASYVLLAIQVGLAPLITLNSGYGTITPQFLLMLGVFIGMFAPTEVVLLAWAMLGAMEDLRTSYVLDGTGMEPLMLVGPYVLGYIFAGYMTVQLRGLVFRQHPLAFGIAVFISGVLAHLVIITILMVRNAYDGFLEFSAIDELLRRMILLAYTAGVAVLLTKPFMTLTPWFNFQPAKRG